MTLFQSIQLSIKTKKKKRVLLCYLTFIGAVIAISIWTSQRKVCEQNNAQSNIFRRSGIFYVPDWFFLIAFVTRPLPLPIRESFLPNTILPNHCTVSRLHRKRLASSCPGVMLYQHKFLTLSEFYEAIHSLGTSFSVSLTSQCLRLPEN